MTTQWTRSRSCRATNPGHGIRLETNISTVPREGGLYDCPPAATCLDCTEGLHQVYFLKPKVARRRLGMYFEVENFNAVRVLAAMPAFCCLDDMYII